MWALTVRIFALRARPVSRAREPAVEPREGGAMFRGFRKRRPEEEEPEAWVDSQAYEKPGLGPTQRVIYLPVRSKELRVFAEAWCALKRKQDKLAQVITADPEGLPLCHVSPHAKVYVLIHGNPLRPVVSAEGETLTAWQLACRIRDAGLNLSLIHI